MLMLTNVMSMHHAGLDDLKSCKEASLGSFRDFVAERGWALVLEFPVVEVFVRVSFPLLVSLLVESLW